MGKEDVDFISLFEGKRLPLLTLDKRWHDLFPDYEKTSEIKHLEHKLNESIKRQGQLTHDIKDLKNLKVQLMNQIVNNMEATLDSGDTIGTRKLNKSQKLIKEINEKLKNADLELDELPDKIKEYNIELMIVSMNIYYEKLKYNSEQIKEIGAWVSEMRLKLKDKILIKQDMEIKNEEIYSYIHNLLGPKVVQILDDRFGMKDYDIR